MFESTRKFAIVTAFAAGLGPFVVLPASAADWYQPGDPTQREIERGDRIAADWYKPGNPAQGDVERGESKDTSERHDIYGTD